MWMLLEQTGRIFSLQRNHNRNNLQGHCNPVMLGDYHWFLKMNNNDI